MSAEPLASTGDGELLGFATPALAGGEVGDATVPREAAVVFLVALACLPLAAADLLRLIVEMARDC